jgi:excisionase family DNA binding protein
MAKGRVISPPTPGEVPEYLTYRQLEARSGISRHTWRQWARSGRLRSTAIGRLRLVRREVCEQFMRDHE